MIAVLSILIGTTVEAKEMTILNDGKEFIDSLNVEPDKIKSEIITTTQYELIGYFNLTAYCSCSSCCGKSDGITASGTRAQANHTIAADTRVLPFGTVVYINGEDYVVEDTGSAIHNNRIDVYFNSHSEAKIFGRRYEGVYTKMEKEIELIGVHFTDYVLISGYMMSKGVAQSSIDKTTGNVTWTNQRGDVVATRTRLSSGEYENRVDKSIYNEWKARR